ncbi:C-terminal domain phosphatase-like 4 [Rhynchospora pubera]|uniref:RNA polymerase II C-terminal domain phosphatase-like n=1 Tax=Rhynchospora pubera TaxID=906938 RepID=A0AAV8GUJ7_9POAL|nr:C-terminal domain phosphatase-like 4 [Rhynchospora pubera]
MNLAAESPSSSCSSGSTDDFAAFLENEIEAQIEEEEIEEEHIEEEDDDEIEIEIAEHSNKRRKVMDDESTDEESPLNTVDLANGQISNGGNVVCAHPIIIRNLCSHCGEFVEEAGSSVAFNYIHKDLRLGASEIEKLRKEDLKHLLKDKKLILVLDLDHTLINSSRMIDIIPDEQYLIKQVEEGKETDDPNQTLFQLGRYHMLTKLRPFVRTFLKEAKNMFEMYIYTMGERAYAMEIAKLLDPGDVYFSSKVICQSDCTTRNQKGLDVVLGADNLVIILDDTEHVWHKHKENLILMERYHYFASSVRQFSSGIKSLSEMKKDERESDGILATILSVLKRAHEMFFDPKIGIDLSSRDVRQILKLIRQDILEGCNIVFSRVFPSDVQANEQPIWKLAEQLGATCLGDVDDSVTHVVAVVPNTQKAEWARDNNKFLVTPRWIEAANYLWQRQKEEDFAVPKKVDK